MNRQGQRDTRNGAASPQPGHILVADDEVVIRALLTEILAEEGYEVTTAEDGKQAVDLLQLERFDLIIADLVMPGLNGVEVLMAAKRIDPQYPVIIITGYPSVNTAVRLVKLGATDYITKPFNVDLIKVTVAKVLEMRKGERAATRPDLPSHLPSAAELQNPTITICSRGSSRRRLSVLSGEAIRVASLIAEIDNFEAYSNRERVSEGNELLKSFTRTLSRESRPGDVIGQTDEAELALLLPETDRDQANTLGQRIRRKLGWYFTISAGMACFPRDASDALGMIKVARAAVKASKSGGGDTLVLPN